MCVQAEPKKEPRKGRARLYGKVTQEWCQAANPKTSPAEEQQGFPNHCQQSALPTTRYLQRPHRISPTSGMAAQEPPIPLSLCLAHLHPLSTPHGLHLCWVLHRGVEPRLFLAQHGCRQWKKEHFSPNCHISGSWQEATPGCPFPCGQESQDRVARILPLQVGPCQGHPVPLPQTQPRHLLVSLQHQDELSALGHHGHLCPGRRQHLRRKQRRDGVRKGRAQDAASRVPVHPAACLYYCRTYCSVSNTKGSRCNGF